jgi:enoyl-[acyl-carrier protein] reductase II
MAALRTKLCDLLGIETPIMLAGMGGIAGMELTAAVSNAGGFGTWGSAVDLTHMGPDEIQAQVEEISRMCGGKPFGVDTLIHGSDGGVMPVLIDAFAKGGAKAYISGKGFPRKDVIKLFHDRGMLVASIAGKVEHATRAVEAGVDFIIVQGYEGGGHTGETALSVLLPQTVDKVAGRVPVVAAGGIYDGRGLASALMYGASGVWVGTRFMMTPEANTHALYKERLLRATSDESMVTKCYTGARLRIVRNAYTTNFEKHPELIEDNSAKIARRAWADGCWRLHSGNEEELAKGYSDDNQAYVAGQNIGSIDTLIPAGQIVKEMTDTAVTLLKGPPGVIVHTAKL